VALASNFDERLFEIARVVEPLTLADHVFASSELGWRKPAPEFFRAVEQRLGRQPEELVLVGDDPLLDIAAARNAGWQAVSVAAAPV
jgi:putative hydrolase of the HAD superfamily